MGKLALYALAYFGSLILAGIFATLLEADLPEQSSMTALQLLEKPALWPELPPD